MQYLLDTCVIIDLVKGDKSTIDMMKSVSPNQVSISTITAFELKYGLEKASNLKSKTRSIVEAILAEINTRNFGTKEAASAAVIRNHLRKLGKPIGPYDVLIAATALSNGLKLITSNEKEFSRVDGISMENWR